MDAGYGHLTKAKITHKVKKIFCKHTFIETVQVSLVGIQFRDNRLFCSDLGPILQAKTDTFIVFDNKFSDGRAGQYGAAVGFDIALHGYRQHAAAAFRNGLSIIVDTGDHDVETGGGAQLVGQGLRRRCPTQDKGAHMVVLEILQGELAGTQLVIT